MPRKIFISILGTSSYLETRYYFGENPKGDEQILRFVQEFSIQKECINWEENDKVRIFLTDESENKNWVDNGNREQYEGLETRLKSLNYNFNLSSVKIPEGFSENEIWEIFQKVFDEIEEESEIYFDITHAFRSIPMLVMVLINYAKLLKNVTIKGIYYGAFEKLGPAYLVKDKPVEERFAPVLDLVPFSQLQDWTNATQTFLKSGRVNDILNLLGEGEDIDKLQDFTGDIITNRGLEILDGRKVSDLKNYLKNFNPGIVPFKEIKNKINDKLKPFKQGSEDNGFKAVEFCIEHGLIQQGITLLQESIVTKVMYITGERSKDVIKSHHNRNVFTRALQNTREGVIIENLLNNRERENESKYSKKVKKINNWLDKIFDLEIKDELTNEVFLELSNKIRNDINHGGYRPDPLNSQAFYTFLTEKYDIVKRLFKLV